MLSPKCCFPLLLKLAFLAFVSSASGWVGELCLLCVTQALSSLPAETYWMLIDTPWGGYSYYSSFTGHESKALEGRVSHSPDHTVGWWMCLGLRTSFVWILSSFSSCTEGLSSFGSFFSSLSASSLPRNRVHFVVLPCSGAQEPPFWRYFRNWVWEWVRCGVVCGMMGTQGMTQLASRGPFASEDHRIFIDCSSQDFIQTGGSSSTRLLQISAILDPLTGS